MQLLRPVDRVGVLAVDDTLEWAVPVRQVGSELPIRLVQQIRARGGGILIYTSLDAARSAFKQHPTPLRHVILFADAQDAEEKVQGHLFGWGAGATSFDLVGNMASAGITLSVVAVGTARDQDTDFLSLLAEIGGGRIYREHPGRTSHHAVDRWLRQEGHNGAWRQGRAHCLRRRRS